MSADDPPVAGESLGTTVDRELREVGHVVVEAGGSRAEIEAVDIDRLGVVVERVRVDRSGPGVVERAQRIADRIRPGGERLEPVEVDSTLGGGTLRTTPEDMVGGRFYQVDIDDQGAEIGRYVVGADGSRAREPFTLTREALRRAVDALDARPDPPGVPGPTPPRE